MKLEKRRRKKFLQKSLLRLRVNPLNDNKFLKLTTKAKMERRYERRRLIDEVLVRFPEKAKKRKEKWEKFSKLQEKKNRFFQKYRPYSFHDGSVSKFASLGNSLTKQFRSDLFAKKIFNYHYGGLKRNFLKKQTIKIFKSHQNARELSVIFFESRLDTVLKRATFCKTIKEARQAINHRHILVNNRIESNYAYVLKQGDFIQVKQKYQKIVRIRLKNNFKERFNGIIWPMIPSYLSINYNELEIIFGKLQGFNFGLVFNFKNDFGVVTESHRRH